MNLLITVNNFSRLRGKKTFLLSLFKTWYLNNKEFSITVLCNEKGRAAELSKQFGVKVITNKEELEKEYDCILMFDYCVDVEDYAAKKILYCHDLLANFDSFYLYKIDRYICITEEIQDKLKAVGIQSDIIRNGIDMSVFLPDDKEIEKEKIQSILLFNYLPDEHLKILKNVCENNNIKLDCTFLKLENQENIAQQMREHDLIISVGRGCYEAMSCGKEVLIWSSYGIDGLASEDFKHFKTKNCSGRYNHITKVDNDTLQSYFDKYDYKKALLNRVYIKNEFNMSDIACLIEAII